MKNQAFSVLSDAVSVDMGGCGYSERPPPPTPLAKLPLIPFGFGVFWSIAGLKSECCMCSNKVEAGDLKLFPSTCSFFNNPTFPLSQAEIFLSGQYLNPYFIFKSVQRKNGM